MGLDKEEVERPDRIGVYGISDTFFKVARPFHYIHARVFLISCPLENTRVLTGLMYTDIKKEERRKEKENKLT